MTAGTRATGDSPQHSLLASRLATLGLRNTTAVICHNNRTVMLSFTRNGVLRLHQGYASAPDRVLRAIVRFLNPGVPRVLRRAAEREFLAFPVEAHAPPRPRPGWRESPRPGDVALIHRLESLHHRLNAEHFDGKLEQITIRLSSRMRIRLGELAVDLRSGQALEIALSRRHLARHPWPEIEHTMLHEMVHQWQAETGQQIDHGRAFRRKAREVGVIPAAKRTISLHAASRISG